MSGGIAQLVAVGAQDVHLVGQPEVSFFRSTYKRHTNFSQTVERQVIQGNVSNNGMSTVRFERKGDMLNYVYLVPNNGSATQAIGTWSDVISKVEILVGGQVIDEQDSTYSTLIAPILSATNSSKSVAGDLYGGATAERFYPLRFAFCENWQTALPLIALQYHDVELRITWGGSAANYKWDVYANYAYLDTQEREMLLLSPSTCSSPRSRRPCLPVPRCRSSTSTTRSSISLPVRRLLFPSSTTTTSSSSRLTVPTSPTSSLPIPTSPTFLSITTLPTLPSPRPSRRCSSTPSASMRVSFSLPVP